MLNKQQIFGKESEKLAAIHLKKQGYKIVEKNYKNELGEIDIIAKDKNTLVFVEVKARKSSRYGNAKWGVTPSKQKKISMVALLYLKSQKQDNIKARFDVVSINTKYGKPEVEIVKNAFELAYK
ncbi:MAG: YraN family protein [Desulfobacterales bacterium]|nr:YraN family protein [Desulfobacterales bacterium]